MKNKIVFTQDLPGEREWINSQFPGFTNVETEFSNKWPESEPTDNDDGIIWEIPPESNRNVSSLDCDKIKSLYQLDQHYISHRWTDANSILNNKLTFSSGPKSNYVQVLTFMRCATVFAESILYNKCGYKPVADRPYDENNRYHQFMGGDDSVVYRYVEKYSPDVFLTYRKNWWEWTISMMIGKQHGFFHGNDSVNWKDMSSVSILEEQLDFISNQVRANWQALCHFRTCCPSLNFYIIEYSDIIKQSQLTNHSKLEYDKEKLIKNYTEVKKVFDSKFLPLFTSWESNCINHLTTMGCQVIKSFDQFLVK